MATFNLELTSSLQNSDYHLVQFCFQPQHQLTCNMSSPNVGSASPCLLETLPLEVLTKIYLYSGNLSLASVNKHISKCLSSQFVRIQFCVPLFWDPPDPSPFHNNEAAKKVGRAQTLVFQQSWFSNNFARKLQREIMRLQKARLGTINHPEGRPYCRVRASFFAEIPRELLLQKSWGPTKVKLLHRLLRWGVRLPNKPYHIQPEAMLNAILKNNYRAVNILHNHGGVDFHHKHFQAAVLHDCERRIIEMILEDNDKHRRPFIDSSDKTVYNRLMEWDQARNPMGRQILEDVFWRENERQPLVVLRRPQV